MVNKIVSAKCVEVKTSTRKNDTVMVQVESKGLDCFDDCEGVRLSLSASGTIVVHAGDSIFIRKSMIKGIVEEIGDSGIAYTRILLNKEE